MISEGGNRVSNDELLPLQEENLHYIVEWNNDKGSNFLCQWAGPSAYSYRLRAAD
jgi:hypothetical protein